MKFSEMSYVRPDISAIENKITGYTDALITAADYSQAREAFLKLQQLERHVLTMQTIVSIRHSINTLDKFYDEEQKFWNKTLPTLKGYLAKWNEAMLSSAYRNKFENEYGSIFFVNLELEQKSFDLKIVSELQEENRLTDEYESLLASAAIPFNGGVYTLSQLSPFKNDPDDDIRLDAWKAEGKWYKDNQEALDSIYDRLVHLRDTMGRKLGYDGYTELGYYRMSRNCYSKKDVEAFRKAVVEHVVPIADKIYRRQAERLCKTYPMSFADNALVFRSGNPRPVGNPDEILKTAKAFYEELSKETGEFFNLMLDNELLDVLSTEGKQAGGYCTSIADYEVPFIFANFNGTQHDVEVVTHEAGHAFAGYMNRKRVPVETIWPSLEACEVHSMSMEFFAWPFADAFFGEDARKFRYSHLSSALTFIPYGTMVDHFQHIVFEKPDMTPKERHLVWKELLSVYMPWMRLDGDIPFYSEGEGWQRQHHIYSSPFYYIDYCLAQTVSLEFWAMLQKDREDAFKHYMDYTVLGGSDTFTALLKKAGLDSPFDAGTLKRLCSAASDWLDAYDLSGIK